MSASSLVCQGPQTTPVGDTAIKETRVDNHYHQVHREKDSQSQTNSWDAFDAAELEQEEGDKLNSSLRTASGSSRGRHRKIGIVKTFTDRANNQASLGSPEPAVPSIKLERSIQDGDRFWDGDPSTQSFIRVVGVSASPTSRPPPRPASAPTGDRADSKPFIEQRTDVDIGQQHCVSAKYARNTNNVDQSRVRLLEHRLRGLVKENARLRDGMLDRTDATRLERMTEAKILNFELIAALRTSKEVAERKARRTQDRVRALQNELRRQRSREGSQAGANQGFIKTLSDVHWSKSASQQQQVADTPGLPTPILVYPGMCVNTDVGTPKAQVITLLGDGGEGSNTGTGNSSMRGTTDYSSKGLLLAGDSFFSKTSESPGKFTGSFAAERGRKNDALGTSSAKIEPNGIHSLVVASQPQQQLGNSIIDRSMETAKEMFRQKQEGRKAVIEKEEREERHKSERLAKAAGRSSIGDGNWKGPDLVPRVLLAREEKAARRREERVAAAKEKEQQEHRLSSSFRAAEFRTTNSPDWATIKAHQDLIRKQRTRDRAALMAAESCLPARMAQADAMRTVAEERADAKMRAGVQKAQGEKTGSKTATKKGNTTSGGWEEGGEWWRRGEAREVTCSLDPGDIGQMIRRQQKKWTVSLAAAKASSRAEVTRPLTPPMEKRRLVQEAKRRIKEEADRTTREAMATKRRDDEKRQFQKLVEAYRNRRGTVRETNASRRRAEETRKKTQQDLQVVYNQFEEEADAQRLAMIADEAKQREVSRAMRAYVASSEARRREEHGAGPLLKELIQRKQEEKKAEFRERRRLNREGLRRALRKRPNLLERQEKHAQLHSRQRFHEASSVRAFLESREGFAAAGRRASRSGGAEAGWKGKAIADHIFSAAEKIELGLMPEEGGTAGHLLSEEDKVESSLTPKKGGVDLAPGSVNSSLTVSGDEGGGAVSVLSEKVGGGDGVKVSDDDGGGVSLHAPLSSAASLESRKGNATTNSSCSGGCKPGNDISGETPHSGDDGEEAHQAPADQRVGTGFGNLGDEESGGMADKSNSNRANIFSQTQDMVGNDSMSENGGDGTTAAGARGGRGTNDGRNNSSAAAMNLGAREESTKLML